MMTVSSHISLVTWIEQNAAVAVPALITASAVILGALVSAVGGLAVAVVKALSDIVVALLNRVNGKGDPQPAKRKSPFR